jgi:hypothetical protein
MVFYREVAIPATFLTKLIGVAVKKSTVLKSNFHEKSAKARGLLTPKSNKLVS